MTLFLLAVLFAATNASAQIAPIPDYSGELLARSTLTGDWGGTRSALAAKGMFMELNTTFTYQNLMDGGFDTDDDVLGSTELKLQLDTGHAGLWPGGLLTLRAEGRYGNGIQRKVGALSPVNMDSLFPNVVDHVGEDVLEITELTMVQFLTPKIGLIFGLMNTDSGDANEFTGSIGSNSGFLNGSFLLSPTELRTVPGSTLGAGLIFVVNERIQGSFIALQTEESAGEDPFDTNDGVTLSTEWGVAHTLAGLPGKQTLGFLYAFDNEFNEGGLDRKTLLSALLPGQSLPTQDDSWSFYYNVHQYVQQWDGERGWGLFGRFGVSDGDVNPIDWSTAVGVGGKGLFPGRPADTFGIGYYHMDLAKGALTRFLDLSNEDGFEAWYNVEVTPWMDVTADLQVIDTAFGRPASPLLPILGPGGLLPGTDLGGRLGGRLGARPNSDTAWIFSLRTKIEF